MISSWASALGDFPALLPAQGRTLTHDLTERIRGASQSALNHFAYSPKPGKPKPGKPKPESAKPGKPKPGKMKTSRRDPGSGSSTPRATLSRATLSRATLSKEEIYRRVLEAALRLDSSRGHLRWRMTDLSRASGITRSLIYYYFGNSKTALLQSAVRALGEEFFGLREDRQELWRQGRILESIAQTRLLVQTMPYLVHFYLAQRHPGAPLYDQILELERRYSENLRHHFPDAEPARIQMTFAMLFGVVTLSELSEQAFHEAVVHILSPLDRQRSPRSPSNAAAKG